MIATSPTAASTFGYATGTAGSITVPADCRVIALSCSVAGGGAAGSVTMTQGGAGTATSPPGGAGAVLIPAGSQFSRDWPNSGPLGPGSVIVFAGTQTYYVEYAQRMVGG